MPLEVIIGLGGGMIAVLIILHIFLLMIGMQKLAKQKHLNKQWEALLPEKQNVDAVLNSMRKLQDDVTSIESITKGEGLSWARKLNLISDSLPKGVWLKKVALGDAMIFIEGSAVSKSNAEMTGVHKLAASLRDSQDFLSGLSGLEITSIQSKPINGTEVMDFLITGKVQ